MRHLIYTAVFNGYDQVYPPVCPSKGADHVIVTNDSNLKVTGWHTLHVDTSLFATPKAANLYYRALIHRILPEYDASLYIDGNIRLLGPTSTLFESLFHSGAAAMFYAHPLRSTVFEELDAVIKAGKLSDVGRGQNEFQDYRSDGFPDNVGLVETGIILKNHRHAGLDEAMDLWEKLFQKYLSRDQLSLPYVIWKTNLDIAVLPGTFRNPNPYFACYPHVQDKSVNPFYAHVSARSHDSFLYRALLSVWHGIWSVRRSLR